MLVDDVDYYTNASEYEKIMSKIIKTYSRSHEASEGRITLIKISSYFLNQIKEEIVNAPIRIEIINIEMDKKYFGQNIKIRSVCITSIGMEWLILCYDREMKIAIVKLIINQIKTALNKACISACLMKNLYFGRGILKVTKK